MRNTAIWILALLLLPNLAPADESTIGWSKTKPASGRYVETDRGFMVPYTRKIPGTDASYSMVPIPGGTFVLGSPADESGRKDDEGPQVTVEIKPFWMGKFEVTWAEYKEFMGLYAIFKDFETRGMRKVTDSNKVDAITAPTELYDPSFTFEFGEDPQQPAVTMTQYAAKQYTKWVSGVTGQQYRLPSEAEWEYACRAGTKSAFSFGDDAGQLDDYAWHYDNSEETSHLVGQKKPNPWGLYDMHGNVWEWVLDAYDAEGYQRLSGATHQAVDTIAWPTKLFPRAVRGGSWDDDPEACRSAAKMKSHDIEWKAEDPNLPLSPWWFTSDPSRAVGFRLLRPANPLPAEQLTKYWDPDVEDVDFAVESRLLEGRGVLGLVDEQLPAAIKMLQE